MKLLTIENIRGGAGVFLYPDYPCETPLYTNWAGHWPHLFEKDFRAVARMMGRKITEYNCLESWDI